LDGRQDISGWAPGRDRVNLFSGNNAGGQADGVYPP
jgi:hypothetical protein